MPPFLSSNFPHSPPRLYVTAEDDDFDEVTLQDWRAEGFNVAYVPLGAGGEEYAERLDSLKNAGLGVGEQFAIIAYGDAASFCLDHYASPTSAGATKLGALIAYYPSTIPDPSPRNTHFPGQLQVLVHLAGSTIGVRKTQQLLGIQGKRSTIRKSITPGKGTGGSLKLAFPTYTYENVDPGFAEHDLDEYDRVAEELAWGRTLEVLMRVFHRQHDVERVWEVNEQNKFKSSSSVENRVSGIINSLTTSKTPHVTHTPTLIGGIGTDELQRFYADYFIASNPPSLRLRLLSRTVGVDRVVDELYVSFQHSHVMPWILPGIPATNKTVEVIVVSIVCMRGGKLYHEHVYWDQASVLVQVGLLDAKVVPESMKRKGVVRLPVIGREAARSVLSSNDGKEVARNELIPGWKKEAPGSLRTVDQGRDKVGKEEKPKQSQQREEEADSETEEEAEAEPEEEGGIEIEEEGYQGEGEEDEGDEDKEKKGDEDKEEKGDEEEKAKKKSPP